MSVTFHVVETVVPAWQITCACGAVTAAQTYPLYKRAARALKRATVTCGDDYCAAYGPSLSTVDTEADAYMVNMANANAYDLFYALGLDTEDMCGTLPADDLRGRILLAQAISPADEGRPEVREGNVIHCARPAGYVEMRLAQLTDLVDYASAHDLAIAWS